MDFKKSFMELKKPVLWFHYALGTLWLFAIYTYLLRQPFIEASIMSVLVFYLIYILVDRTVHGVLNI